MHMGGMPFVSVIIPLRNEKRFMEQILEPCLQQDYPKERVEFIFVDGMSTDGTRDVIAAYAGQYPFIKLFNNPQCIVPTAMNIGIREAKGEIIVRMDGHTEYPDYYISKCVKYLCESGADNVGGICITMPANNTIIAQAMALSLSSPFGVGNSFFRIGSKEPRYVDTVPFGCYKREVFDRIGLFDEDLVRNQDDEFNLRLIKSGGKILLVPEIVSYYYARDSLSKVARMFYQYGYFKPLVVQKVGGVLTWRQVMPALFVVCLTGNAILSVFLEPFIWLFLVVASLYLVLNLGASFHIALKKDLKLFFVLPAAFATLHFSYGIGYLKGIWDFIILKKNKRKIITDLPLTR